MFDNSCILNLQLRLWDSYIALSNVKPPRGEGRRSVAVTHLASARRQKAGTGISGATKDYED